MLALTPTIPVGNSDLGWLLHLDAPVGSREVRVRFSGTFESRTATTDDCRATVAPAAVTDALPRRAQTPAITTTALTLSLVLIGLNLLKGSERDNTHHALPQHALARMVGSYVPLL
jgi:hypothetical protein